MSSKRRDNADPFIKGGFYFIISHSSDSFRYYLSFQEDKFTDYAEVLKREYDDLIDAIKANPNDYSEEYQYYLKEDAIENFRRLEDEFKHRFRESIILQLCSFFEVQLDLASNFISQDTNTVNIYKKYADKNGNKIENLKKYYIESFNWDIGENAKDWEFIKNLRVLRNTITHQGCKVDLQKKGLKRLVNFSKNNFSLLPIQYSDKYSIKFDNVEFLKKSIDIVEKTLISIIRDYKSNEV